LLARKVGSMFDTSAVLWGHTHPGRRWGDIDERGVRNPCEPRPILHPLPSLRRTLTGGLNGGGIFFSSSAGQSTGCEDGPQAPSPVRRCMDSGVGIAFGPTVPFRQADEGVECVSVRFWYVHICNEGTDGKQLACEAKGRDGTHPEEGVILDLVGPPGAEPLAGVPDEELRQAAVAEWSGGTAVWSV